MHSQSGLLSSLRIFGYDFHSKGACASISAKACEAVLLRDMETFNRRLDLIRSYTAKSSTVEALRSDSEKLHRDVLNAEALRVQIVAEMKQEAMQEFKRSLEVKAETREIDEKVGKDFIKNLNPEQQKIFSGLLQEKIEKKMAEQSLVTRDLLMVRGFFDSLMVIQTNPGNLFETIPQVEKGHIISKDAFQLTRSVLLEAQGGIALDDSPFCGAYSHAELCTFFQTLSVALKDFTQPVALLLGSGTHGTAIGYDPGTKNWTFTDANSKKNEKILTIEQLSNTVMTGFFTRSLSLTAFRTNIFTSPRSEVKNLNECLVRWKSTSAWKDMHKVTREKTGYVDHYPLSRSSNLLYLATQVGDNELIKELLKAGADPNVGYSTTCLSLALYHALPHEIIQTLLDYGADPNKKDAQGFAPLASAAQKGSPEAVQLLCKKGAKLNAVGLGAAIILLNFAEGKNRKIQMEKLLGSATEIPGMTALHLAVFFGRIEIVRALLAAGADPHQNTHQGISNLQFAEAMGHTEIAELFTPLNLLLAKINKLALRVAESKDPRSESIRKIQMDAKERIEFPILQTTFNDFLKLDHLISRMQGASDYLATADIQSELKRIADSSYQNFLENYPPIEKIIQKFISDLKPIHADLDSKLPKGFWPTLFPPEGQALVNNLRELIKKGEEKEVKEVKQQLSGPK